MTRGAHLIVSGLAKSYGSVVALAPTDLEVAPGEFVALVGPSGSGKTTLLGAIVGFIAPSAGSVRLDGAEIVAVPPYKRNIGMVFQNYTLFPHMSVAENIAFPLRMRNLPRSEIEARVARMLDMVRLPGFGARMPAQLSGGQQQRVALARAASYDPPLLLMDEPLGALDKNLREEMQYEIKQFHHAIGATILYVTHDQDEAASMSDRIAIVNQARVAQIGSARALYERPRNAFVASFLGEANLFGVARATRLDAETMRVETQNGFAFITAAADGADPTAAPLVACIRPEAIRIGDAQEANALRGRIIDVVYTAGTIHYRVEIAPGHVVGIRLPAMRQARDLAVGAEIRIGWNAADMILIPRD